MTAIGHCVAALDGRRQGKRPSHPRQKNCRRASFSVSIAMAYHVTGRHRRGSLPA
ncbi:Hypothetical protein A7982_10887 [Minicystis rosea]|nr:Hypothetical protein A7982_10887 [Minicystis rosea]